MTLGAIAQIVLAEAFAAANGDPIELTVRGRRIDVVVRDHRVVVEVRHVVRVTCVVPPVGDGPATPDERVPLDDAEAEVVATMVRTAIAAGLTPF